MDSPSVWGDGDGGPGAGSSGDQAHHLSVFNTRPF